jgi:hypothetical protein
MVVLNRTRRIPGAPAEGQAGSRGQARLKLENARRRAQSLRRA